ncbi:hypothetical protein ILYODFUR_026388 [Ilyodon furcidens]|uniref:Uncharacterized protein n=1 Tax=Ilyodon furcidens TaxID=33524 RepID=A0ABV0T1Q8_9TELE
MQNSQEEHTECCIPEPDFAFSIVCCFGFLTPGNRSPTLWIKSLGFPPTSSSCNWLAASCLNQPWTSSSKLCPPSVTIEPPPEPQCPNNVCQVPTSLSLTCMQLRCRSPLLADHPSSLFVSRFRLPPYHHVPCK